MIAFSACVAAVLSCKFGSSTSPGKSALSNPGESWCPPNFEIGPSDTCFALPDKPTSSTPVLVYLHGRYEGRGAPAEWEAVRIATERGFAVVLPRGKRGVCPWRAELRDRYCWPEDSEDASSIKDVISEWERVLWQVDALLEGGAHKRYVLGSAEGGAFAALLATRGLFSAQAYAVVNGGSLGSPGKTKPVPILLMSAASEHSEQNVKELHEALTKASWPHALCSRTGGGMLTEDDVEVATRFFQRDADGALRLQGGAYACEASSSSSRSRR